MVKGFPSGCYCSAHLGFHMTEGRPTDSSHSSWHRGPEAESKACTVELVSCCLPPRAASQHSSTWRKHELRGRETGPKRCQQTSKRRFTAELFIMARTSKPRCPCYSHVSTFCKCDALHLPCLLMPDMPCPGQLDCMPRPLPLCPSPLESNS